MAGRCGKARGHEDGDDPAARLEAVVRATPDLMHVLRTARALDLPDWLIFSGAVYQPVWNHLTGREPSFGIKDYDLAYFDASDISYEAEDAVIRRVAGAFEPPLRQMVEVRNQARVHICSPTSTANLIRRWPAAPRRWSGSPRRPSPWACAWTRTIVCAWWRRSAWRTCSRCGSGPTRCDPPAAWPGPPPTPKPLAGDHGRALSLAKRRPIL